MRWHTGAARLASWVCLAALLAGCTVLGPDYREPELDWLQTWQPGLYGQLGRPGAEDADELRFWWRLFDDPVLNELVAIARRENPSLRIAGLRVLESRARLAIARGQRWPQLQQASGSAAYVDSWLNGASPTGGDQDLGSFSADVTVAWELDFWGRFRRGIESADAAYLASIADQRDVQVLLTAQVVDAYFAYRTAVAQTGIARDNASIQERSFEITRRRYEGGQESELDLQQARSQYLGTLATIPVLERSAIQARNALALLLGRPPGELPPLPGEEVALPAVGLQQVNAIPARLLHRRPDVRAAAWQVAAQSAQIGIAEANLYPAISLFGTVGYAGDTLSASPDSVTTVLGSGFTWNFLNYGRLRNNVRVQDARLQQAVENYRNSVLTAAREIDDAAIAVAKIAEQLVVLRDSVVAAERSRELANKLFVEGYVPFNRVLDAQAALFAQSTNEISSRAEQIRAVIALYRALGGGWSRATIDDLIPEETRETMEQRTDWGELLRLPLPGEQPVVTPEAEDGA